MATQNTGPGQHLYRHFVAAMNDRPDTGGLHHRQSLYQPSGPLLMRFWKNRRRSLQVEYLVHLRSDVG